jgi:hypothetical protein
VPLRTVVLAYRQVQVGLDQVTLAVATARARASVGPATDLAAGANLIDAPALSAALRSTHPE